MVSNKIQDFLIMNFGYVFLFRIMITELFLKNILYFYIFPHNHHDEKYPTPWLKINF